MINAAWGEVCLRQQNDRWLGEVWVNNGGISYAFQAHNQIEPGDGKHIYFHWRISPTDGEVSCYGFGQQQARDLFRILIKVSGVGPAVVLALMNTLSMSDLTTAIIQGDTAKLCKAKGVGRKAAEKIVLDVQQRIKEWASSQSIELAADDTGLPTELAEEVTITLSALGYSRTEVASAIATIAATFDSARGLEDLTLECIRYLTSGV